MNEFIITAIGILVFAIVFAFDNKQTKKTDEIRGDIERLKKEIRELKAEGILHEQTGTKPIILFKQGR